MLSTEIEADPRQSDDWFTECKNDCRPAARCKPSASHPAPLAAMQEVGDLPKSAVQIM